MQVQIKRQLKIELDQADITEAVRNYLASNGYNILEDDLAKINYVKSPKDGLRAELNITEESGDVETETAEPESKPVDTPAPVVASEPESEAPGEVPPARVEDVAPNVEAAVDLVLAAEPDVEAVTEAAEEPEPVAEAQPRTKLFM